MQAELRALCISAPACSSACSLLPLLAPAAAWLYPKELSIVGTLFCTWNSHWVPRAHKHRPKAEPAFCFLQLCCNPPAWARLGRRRCCTGTRAMGSIPSSATSSPLTLCHSASSLSLGPPPEMLPILPTRQLQGQKIRGGSQNLHKGRNCAGHKQKDNPRDKMGLFLKH